MRNILGDRDIEWKFIKDNIPDGPGTALDFGPGGSTLASLAVQKGFEVWAVDLDDSDWQKQNGVWFMHNDIFDVWDKLPPLDLVIACSTLEHVGIPGRYGMTESRKYGDLDAMKLLYSCMNEGAVMLLTIPVGRDADFTPLCRVYGIDRLPLLFGSFSTEKEEYWMKDDCNVWIETNMQTALTEKTHVESWDPAENYYALGCFVLRK